MSDVPAAPAGQEEGASSNIFQGSATVASVEKEEGLISEVQNWTGGEQDSSSSGGGSGHLLVLVFLVVLDVVTVVSSSFFLLSGGQTHVCTIAFVYRVTAWRQRYIIHQNETPIQTINRPYSSM